MKTISDLRVLCLPYVTNPFFSRLCDGLRRFVRDVSFDIKRMWDDPFAFDILHIHFPEAFYEWGNLLSPSAAFREAKSFITRLEDLHNSGVKIVWTVHNLHSHDPLYPYLDDMVYNGVIKYSHGIIMQCRRTIHLLEERYPASSGKLRKIIPLMNYIDVYPDDVSRHDARSLLGINNDHLVYLCIGQIRPYKGISLLFEAFNKVLSVHPNIILLVAGRFSLKMSRAASYLLRLRSLFHPKIILKAGFINDSDLQIYLNAADVCVFSFKDILMSSSVILAQSFGLPVIAPDTGCLPDLIKEDWGFLYKQGNADDLANRMIQAMDLDLSGMGKKAKNFQLQHDYISIAKRTADFYCELLE